MTTRCNGQSSFLSSPFTGVKSVPGQALFQIRCEADVAAALAARTYQQIDVIHSGKVDACGMRIFRSAKYRRFTATGRKPFGLIQPSFALMRFGGHPT